MRRVVLFGYRGTGKTAIGTMLARRLGVPFLDTDALIEQKSGRTIPDIFKNDGEERFRALEREADRRGSPHMMSLLAPGAA